MKEKRNEARQRVAKIAISSSFSSAANTRSDNAPSFFQLLSSRAFREGNMVFQHREEALIFGCQIRFDRIRAATTIASQRLG
jgi:hypothetical protein